MRVLRCLIVGLCVAWQAAGNVPTPAPPICQNPYEPFTSFTPHCIRRKYYSLLPIPLGDGSPRSHPTSTAPPFTFNTSPRMNPANGVHKNSTGPAISRRSRHAPHRNPRANLRSQRGIGQCRSRHIGGHPSGSNAVYHDSLRRKLRRQALGETDDRSLGHCVIGVISLAPLPGGGTDEYDMSPCSTPIRRGCCTRWTGVPSALPRPVSARTLHRGLRQSCAAISRRTFRRWVRLRVPTLRDLQPGCRAGQSRLRPSRPGRCPSAGVSPVPAQWRCSPPDPEGPVRAHSAASASACLRAWR